LRSNLLVEEPECSCFHWRNLKSAIARIWVGFTDADE
jgi:hypothetical protein